MKKFDAGDWALILIALGVGILAAGHGIGEVIHGSAPDPSHLARDCTSLEPEQFAKMRQEVDRCSKGQINESRCHNEAMERWCEPVIVKAKE